MVMTEKEALEKIYLIKAMNNHGKPHTGYLQFPKCLIGKRIQIKEVLSDENNN